MAERIETGSITIPAGTLSSAPVTADVSFAAGAVDEVELVIPDGCSGLVGVGVQVAHQKIIPWTPGGWIIGNDEVIRWPLDAYPTSGSWQLVGYNSDVFPHTIYARFLVTEPRAPAPGAVTPIVITPQAVAGTTGAEGLAVGPVEAAPMTEAAAVPAEVAAPVEVTAPAEVPVPVPAPAEVPVEVPPLGAPPVEVPPSEVAPQPAQAPGPAPAAAAAPPRLAGAAAKAYNAAHGILDFAEWDRAEHGPGPNPRWDRTPVSAKVTIWRKYVVSHGGYVP